MIQTIGVGVISSLVATIIWLMVISMQSKRFREFLFQVTDFLLHTDLLYVYRDAQEAESDVIEDIKTSSKVRIYTGRGQFLQKDGYTEALADVHTQVEIVIPVSYVNNHWLQARAEEMHNINDAFNAQQLATDIQATETYLESFIARGTVVLRHTNTQHIGKIIILDECAYFTPYQLKKYGIDSKIYKYKANSNMYGWVTRYFEGLLSEEVDSTYEPSVYDDYSHAEPVILRKMQNSKFVYIYSGRGNYFVNNDAILKILKQSNTITRIMLPDADENNKWLLARVKEINKGQFTAKILSTDILQNRNKLEDEIKAGEIDFKYSDAIHSGRIIILEECAFFMPYQNDKFENIEVYSFKKDTALYKWLKRYFDLHWDVAK